MGLLARAFLGFAAFDLLHADRPRWSRFRRTTVVALSLFVPTLWWIHDLTLPGYVIAVLAFAAMFGLCGMLIPPGRGRHLAVPAVWVLTEVWKGHFPFGGVPISDLAIGQVAGPLAGTRRRRRRGPAPHRPRRHRRGVPRCADPAPVVGRGLRCGRRRPRRAGRRHGAAWARHRTAAAGGGRAGWRQAGAAHAINSDPYKVFQRHIDASKRIQLPVDLVVWPENVVELDGATAPTGPQEPSLWRSPSGSRPSSPASCEDRGDHDDFLNYAVVVDPDGRVQRPLREGAPRAVRRVRAAALRWSSRSRARARSPTATPSPAPARASSSSRGRHASGVVDLVGGLLRRPGPRRDRATAARCCSTRPTAPRTPGTMVQTQQIAVEPAAGHRDRPLGAAGGADRLQRDHRPRRAAGGPQRGRSSGAMLQGQIRRGHGLTLFDRWGAWPVAGPRSGPPGGRLVASRTTRT